MDRAVRFYKEFFECGVSERNDVYSVFEINGFRFGLFAYEKVGEAHSFGSNCLPSVSFPDKAQLERKLAGKEICFPLTVIGKNYVAEFVDSEGNHIEVTAPVGEVVTTT